MSPRLRFYRSEVSDDEDTSEEKEKAAYVLVYMQQQKKEEEIYIEHQKSDVELYRLYQKKDLEAIKRAWTTDRRWRLLPTSMHQMHFESTATTRIAQQAVLSLAGQEEVFNSFDEETTANAEASKEQNEKEFAEQAKNRTVDVWKDVQVQRIYNNNNI